MYLTDALYNHIVKGAKYELNKDEEAVPSDFWKEIKKTCMSVDISDKMSVTPGSEGEYIYSINKGMDFLLYPYMYRTYPGYKVKDELKKNVEICWTHNLGHNVITRLDLIIDDDAKQTITNTWLDVYSQFFMKAGFRKKYRMGIYDRKYAQGWTTDLKPCTTKTPIPLFCGKKRNMAIPLFLCSLSKLEIRGNFKTKISELMKMRGRKTENEPWEEIPYKWQSLQAVSGQDQKIDGAPEMFAYYSKIQDHEKLGWKDNIEASNSKSYKLYYEDIIIISPDKFFTSKEPFSQELLCKTTAKSIFWVAQNQKGLKFNNYSNYTTNSLNIESGEHPIKRISYKYGGNNYRFQDMDYTHFDDMMSYYRFPSTPFEKGYGVFSHSSNPSGTDADNGPVFDKDGKITLTLTIGGNNEKGDTKLEIKGDKLLDSIFEDNSHADISENDRYKIFVFILAMKKIEFFNASNIKVSDGNERINPN